MNSGNMEVPSTFPYSEKWGYCSRWPDGGQMHPDRGVMGMGGGTPEKGQGLPRRSGVLASPRDPHHDARGSLTSLGTHCHALRSHLQQPQSEVTSRPLRRRVLGGCWRRLWVSVLTVSAITAGLGL